VPEMFYFILLQHLFYFIADKTTPLTNNKNPVAVVRVYYVRNIINRA